MPRKPEERIALVFEREAGDRLIGAGVEGSNGHRLADGPFGEAAVDAILSLLVRQPCPPLKRNSVRTSPIPSQLAGSSASISAGSAILTRLAIGVPSAVMAGRIRNSSATLTRPVRRSRTRRESHFAWSASGSRTERRAFAVDQRFDPGRRRRRDRGRGRRSSARCAPARASPHDRRRCRALGRCRRRRSNQWRENERASDLRRSRSRPTAGRGPRRSRSEASSTRSRMSRRSLARARKCSSSAFSYPMISSSSAVRHARSAVAPALDRSEGGQPRASRPRASRSERRGCPRHRSAAWAARSRELSERGSDCVRAAPPPPLPARRRGDRASGGVQQEERRTGRKARGSDLPGKSKLSHAALGPPLPRSDSSSWKFNATRSPQRGERGAARRGPWRENATWRPRRLHGHDLDDALGIDPGAILGQARLRCATAKVLASLVSLTEGRACSPIGSIKGAEHDRGEFIHANVSIRHFAKRRTPVRDENVSEIRRRFAPTLTAKVPRRCAARRQGWRRPRLRSRRSPPPPRSARCR